MLGWNLKIKETMETPAGCKKIKGIETQSSWRGHIAGSVQIV
jgi:hypothetical protein